MADGPGSLFERYNSQGALGGLFAPAYVPGFAPSEAAVTAWQAERRPVTSDMIDELRMPDPYQYPSAAMSMGGAGNVYGEGRIPANVGFSSERRGQVDPVMLRRAAMGGRYDVQARRNAIAQRVAENERLAAGAAAVGQLTPGVAITESQWSVPDGIGPAFGRALQQQGLMPGNLRYDPETRTWVSSQQALPSGG
jgi:hypothetical protein